VPFTSIRFGGARRESPAAVTAGRAESGSVALSELREI
jgi:hypothetical protein